MARYLLIEFDDNDSADRMRAQIDTAEANGKNFRVAGMFTPPTRWCVCPESGGYHKEEVVRGGKLGWWVHIACRRARKGTHQLTNLILPSQRGYGIDTGYVCLVDSVSIAEVPVQNIRKD